jgi:hypothetical protein
MAGVRVPGVTVTDRRSLSCIDGQKRCCRLVSGFARRRIDPRCVLGQPQGRARVPGSSPSGMSDPIVKKVLGSHPRAALTGNRGAS